MTETRKRLPAGERRQLILDAAQQAFGELGYIGVTLDTIAAAANVTKPIVYRHFESKDALYLAVLERHREELADFVEDVPADAPLEQIVETILRGWFAYAEVNGGRWRMLFRDSGGSPEIRDSRRRMYDDARDVLAGFLAAHPAFDIADEDLQAHAEVIRGGLSSLVLFGQEHPEAGREQLVRAGTRMVTGLTSG